MTEENLKPVLEALLMAASEPLSLDDLSGYVQSEGVNISRSDIRSALTELQEACIDSGIELREVASGYRYQIRSEYAEWVQKLWAERPARYSRALLETLALIAYRQPITRGEIEEVRGVAVSTQIIRTLLERNWVRVLGHRDVPGRPSLYGTTKTFLDYFNMKSLSDLPALSELKDIGSLTVELALPEPGASSEEDSSDHNNGSQPETLIAVESPTEH